MKISRFSVGLTITLVTIGVLASQMTANAARMIISRQVCDLGVFPFDISKVPTYGAALDPWINHVSNAICKNHLTVPTATPYTAQSYTPQPVADSPDIPLKAGAENYHGPTAIHRHDYYNDSLEDIWYYESFVSKFAIDFAQDTKDNTDGVPYCDTPYPNPAPAGTPTKAAVVAALGDCTGQISGLWGGTKVEKTATGVLWTFGIDDPAAKPRIFGKNPSLDPLIGIDTDNEDYRNFGANVNLTSKDVNSPTNIWSSSTTSRILIRDFAIIKTSDMSKLTSFCSSAGDYSKWCSLPTPAGYQSDTPYGGASANYYWFPIGTTSAVWRKPAPAQTCTALSITNADAQDGIIDAVSGTPLNYNFTVQSTTTGGLNLDYKWTATPVNGSTFDGQASGYVDPDTTTAYANSNPTDGIVITVTAVKEGAPATVYNNCQDTVTIHVPPPQAVCASLDPIVVTPANALQPNTAMTLTTAPHFNPQNQSIPLKLKWTASLLGQNPGNFKDQTVADPNQPASGFIDSVDDFQAFYTGGPGDTVITVQAVDSITNQEITACKQVITIPKTQQPVCESLDPIVVTPANALQPNTAMTLTTAPHFNPQNQSIPLKLKWTANLLGQNPGNFKDQTAADPNQPASGFIDSIDDFQAFYTGGPGDTVITAQAVDSVTNQEITACKQVITIPKPPPDVCDSLTIYRNNAPFPQSITLNDPNNPTEDLYVVVNKSQSLNLDYKWSANSNGVIQGVFTSVNGSNNPLVNLNENDLTDYVGASPQNVTALSVEAYDPNDPAKKILCADRFVINPPAQPACVDFDILQNGFDIGNSIQVQDPLSNLSIQVNSNIPLDFRWTAKNSNVLQGTFTSPGYGPNNALTVNNNSDLVSYTGATNGIIITAEGIVPNSNQVADPSCVDQFTMTQPPPQNVCVDLGLSPANASVSFGGTVNLAANPQNQFDPDPKNLRWSETGPGFFTMGSTSQALNVLHGIDPITNPIVCDAPLNDQPFTRPKECDYIYHAGPDGGGTFSVEVEPSQNIGNVEACKYHFDVPAKPPENPTCLSLDLNPDTIKPNISNPYTGAATFSDGGTYPVNVSWAGTNGTFTSGTTTNSSSQSIGNTFTSNANNGHVKAHVDNFLFNGSTVTVPANQCGWEIDLKAPPCEHLELYNKPETNEICVQVTGTYSGDYTWVIGGNKISDDDECIDFTFDSIYVYANGQEQTCHDERPKVDVPPPKVTKGVRVSGTTGPYNEVMSIQSSQIQKGLDYQINVYPNHSYPYTATILDEISDGIIQGETKPGSDEGGHVEYADSMTVTANGVQIPVCGGDIDGNCYVGDIGQGGVTLVKVIGNVTITYKGVIKDSKITPQSCVEGIICQEIYENIARAINVIIHYDEENEIPLPNNYPSNDVRVQLFCQYILTRAAGDIFLETDLNAGVDIRQCSRYKSTTGVIITPGETPLPSTPSTGTGQEGTIFAINHEICTEGQAGTLDQELKPFYGEDVSKNLSSQICEVKLRSGEAWKQTAITNSIDENKTRISRWEPDYEFSDAYISDIMSSADYESKQVFHVKDHDLIIDRPYTLSDGDGAKTFIIENGDLVINQEIKYGTCPADKAPCNVRDIASLAFIVLNGSVYVDPSMTSTLPNEQTIAGVYFVQEGAGANTGLLFSGTPGNTNEASYKKLTVYGSIYGDIEPLFIQRQFSGSPEEEEAGIVIRFDERVILNTPPGLRDVLNLTETEVARSGPL